MLSKGDFNDRVLDKGEIRDADSHPGTYFWYVADSGGFLSLCGKFLKSDSRVTTPGGGATLWHVGCLNLIKLDALNTSFGCPQCQPLFT